MLIFPLMAATFFKVPIERPPHVILRSVEPVTGSEVARSETTTPDLLLGLGSSDPARATLPQPIYPAPSPGQGGKTSPDVTPSPTVPPTPPPQPDSTESWVNRLRRRYGVGGGGN